MWGVAGAAERGSRWRRPARIIRDLEATGLLVVVALASALLLLPRGDDGLIGLPTLTAGVVAPRTVTSPRSYSTPDPDLTRQTRMRARAAVHPVFDHLIGSDPKVRLGEAFRAAESSKLHPAQTFVDALGAQLELKTVGPLLKTDQRSMVVDAASMLLEALHQRRLVSDPAFGAVRQVITVRAVDADGQVTSEQLLSLERQDAILGPSQARSLVDALASERLEHLTPRLRSSVISVVKELITPNLVPNHQETRRRQGLAWTSAKQAVIQVRKGEKIIRAGERVTERDLLVLSALKELESPQARLQSVLGSALLGVVLAWLAYRSARHAYRHRLPKKKDLVFLTSVFLAYLLLVWAGFKLVEWLNETKPIADLPVTGYRWVLPLSAVTIVVRLSAGPIAAAATAPVVGLLAGWGMDGDLDFAAYALCGAFAAASTVPGAKRITLAAGVGAGVVQAFVVVGTTLLAGRFELRLVAIQVGFALISGLLASALARMVLPAVEALFGYTTPTGLAAFADAEHPLLRELLVEVPGTYHHSLNVGGLAEAGARAIGSDRLLARVGGYLHDVGRIGGQKEAVFRRRSAAQLAVEHRFPAELAQILAEQPHEGVGKRVEERRTQPRSKTSALVALADRVEGALSGQEGQFVDEAALELVVRDEIRAAVAERLLDEAALELRELAAVQRAFTETLKGRFVTIESGQSGSFRVPRVSGLPPN